MKIFDFFKRKREKLPAKILQKENQLSKIDFTLHNDIKDIIWIKNGPKKNINSDKISNIIEFEIGYLPIQKIEADLFFQLLTLRYERKSTLVTSNITLSRWRELFQNPEITAAILDRLVHHAKIFKLAGKSYRLKGKLKSD